MSSVELAEVSFTSKATVVRLCKKLGLSGYQEFRLKLVEEINQKNSVNFTSPSIDYMSIFLILKLFPCIFLL